MTSRDKERIRLAEAMGHPVKLSGTPNGSGHLECIDGRYLDFDPFTDANDDYAVLEWMRDGEREAPPPFPPAMKRWMTFAELFQYKFPYRYQIGDYARAALKVIGDSPTESEPQQQ